MRSIFVLLIVSLYSNATFAQTYRAKTVHEFTFSPDGTVTTRRRFEATPLVQAGVQLLSQYTLSHEGNQTLDIVHARTRKQSGEIIPVTPSDIAVQVGAVGQMQSYIDLTLRRVPFRGLGVGDTIEMEFVETEKKHYLPDRFSKLVYLPETNSRQELDVIVHVPDGIPFRFTQKGYTHTRTRREKVTTHRWTGVFERAAVAERNVMNSRANDPVVAFSTMADYAELGDVYAQAIADKLLPSPEVQQLARRITAGRESPRAKAQAIFDWVTANIHYVGVYFGAGRIIPNAPASVLARQFGDCKDQALLMSALLAAAGIEARQALIQTDAEVELPAVAALGAFNHVIVYIPSLDLYADPTDPTSNLGVLPASDAGKPVLIVEKGRSRLAHTPAVAAQGNSAHVRTRIVVAEDLNASGTTTTTARGEWAGLLRQFVGKKDIGGLEAAIAGLPASGARPTGMTMEAPAMTDHADPYTLTINWKFDAPLPLLKQGWLPGVGLTPIDPERSSVLDVSETARRKLPARCNPGEIVLDEEIVLPAGLRPSFLAPPVSFVTPLIRYFSGWTFADGVLSRHVRVLSETTARICSAEAVNQVVDAVQSVTNREDIVLRFERDNRPAQPVGAKP